MAADHEHSRLTRSRQGRILAGVCSGVSRYVGIDPVVARVALVAFTLASGEGVLFYIVAALVLPSDEVRTAPAERLLRRRFDAPTALLVLGCLLAALVVLGTVTHGMSTDPLVTVTLFVLVLLVAHARNVDLRQVARSLPERLQGRPLPPDEPPSPDRDVPDLTPEMVDLATLGGRPAFDARPPVSLHKAPAVPAPAASRRPRSALSSVTLLGALMAGAAMIPVAFSGSIEDGPRQAQLLIAPALAVVGLGLVVSGWVGRGRGLTTVGTLLTLSLLTTTAAAEVPPDTRFGEVDWQPTDASRLEQRYRVGAGDGRLVLTGLRLSPGQRVTIDADLYMGKLTIMLPHTARIELDAKVWLGDLTVGKRIVGGPNAKAVEVLESSSEEPQPPVIELRIRSRMGDVVVDHG
jgi:phage shock protein PspC (stress-responsive transcriptional regulator)